MATRTVNLEGAPVTVTQRHVELTKLQLDDDNPRIGLYRDSQPKDGLVEADIRHAIRNRSPHTYSKLRDSIEINGAIINPIWIGPEEGGKHLVIEGNTRVLTSAGRRTSRGVSRPCLSCFLGRCRLLLYLLYARFLLLVKSI